MRNSKEYLKNLFEEPFYLEEGSIEDDFLKVIKQVQIEAIEEAVKRCAEETTLLINNLSSTDKEYNDYYQCGDDQISVNRKGISKIAEKMKEELE